MDNRISPSTNQIDHEFAFDPSVFKKLGSVANNIKTVLEQEAFPVDVGQFQEKIFIRWPYFAFEKIYQFEDVLIAPIKPQQQIFFESTPMAAAEASRHLAILGSCALSIEEDSAHYYLAVNARKRIGNNPHRIIVPNQSTSLFALAQKISNRKGLVSAATSLIQGDGEIIFNFQIKYLKLSERSFKRLFKKHLRPTHYNPLNPYYRPLEFKEVSIRGDLLCATLPTIDPIYCAGHFDNAPILPVGVLAYMVGNTIGYFLANTINDAKYRYHLEYALMDIHFPTDNSQIARLLVHYTGSQRGGYSFHCRMESSENQTLNTMQLSFVKHYQLINVAENRSWE